MSGWITETTRELIDQGFLEIGDGYRAKNSEMAPEGVPFVRAGDVAGRVNTTGTDRLSLESVAKVGRKRAMPGDVVMTTKGTIGRLAFVKSGDPEFIYSPQLCFWRSLNREVIDPRWLFFAMEGPEMLDQISWSAGQTDMAPYVSLTDQRTAFKLTLPPISEQREIASILGALDDKIELNRRMAATLEEMARALFRSWFVDFDPVKAKAEGLAPAFMDEATAALFPDRFGDDGLPDGWGLMPLSSLCVQAKDSIDPRKNTDRTFDHYSLPAFDTGKGPVRELGAAIQSQKLLIPTEAILFSRLNPNTPRIWWARTSDQVFASVASTEFLVAVARIKEDMPFLYSLLVSDEFRGNVISRVTGTSNSHQRVKPSSVLDIEVVGATDEIRTAYGAVTAPWFDRIDELSQENRTLAALRDALLPKLMSGELRVVQARDQVEVVT